MKKNKGITLIALIITIIVLLILAGVAIATLNNGENIPKNAGAAVEKYDQGIKNEADEIKAISDFLKSKLANATDSLDQTVGVSGKGTESEPYLIESIEDLVKFSQDVENGEDFAGKVVKLAQDLDFNNPNSYIDSERTDMSRDDEEIGLLEEMTTGRGFFPIGVDYGVFAGTFDGQGHTIYNLYQDNTSDPMDYLGLFGYVENGFVKKINVTGSVKGILNPASASQNVYNVGGIIGKLYSDDEVTIENCTFNGTIEATGMVGGIVGFIESSGDVTVNNCTMRGTVSASKEGVAGVVGIATTNKITITNCTNMADITSLKYAGGILGYSESTNEVIIKQSSNSGQITTPDNNEAEGIGGILGFAEDADKLLIENCTNTGKLMTTKAKEAAGILGKFGHYEDSKITIKECTNSGEVELWFNGAGILGTVWADPDTKLEITLSNNRNSGNVHANAAETLHGLAGIAGNIGSDGDIELKINNCYNSGNIDGNVNGIAGILGITSLESGTQNVDILNCLNIGTIGTNAGNCQGGIVGELYSDDDKITATIKNCANTGNIGKTGKSEIGGIIGTTYTTNAESTIDISNCCNVGTVLGSTTWGVGGISGGVGDNVTETASNAFYLEDSIYAAMENDNCAIGTSKTETEMKANTTDSVLQILNTEANTHSSDPIPYLIWKQNSNLYPVINL